MSELTLGVVATSRKPDERRLALHPAQLDRIDAGLRARMVLESGYGERFGYPDERLAALVGGVGSRDEALAQDVVLLPKPLAEDLVGMRPGQVVWGWPHCVQDFDMTQNAIDGGLTLIAWEAMNRWTPDGGFDIHVFHKNNELAGYASVLHALQLMGTTGAYGRRLSAAVISFGATARGAVRALQALGVHDVTVFTQRDVTAVASPFAGVRMDTFSRDPIREGRARVGDEDMARVLSEFDVVVNCILQDTDAPLVFVDESELDLFDPRMLFVDVSCDEGMGFSWARPTSFAAPMFRVGGGRYYYAVDHSPSHLWNSSTWENSLALLEFLPVVLAGPDAWSSNETIRRAIEIHDGRVLNEKILSFQGRSAEYPYPPA